ncbi:MAG: autotransporter outer membrane beta-barrel domain-containing protein [Candidatus Kaistia colombiensis]|nr:MAG: autotransporter outer membrane beta-barrel domain-containing protein [Kaistia sp.]
MVLALAVAGGALGSAHAATYTVANEEELFDAIRAVNRDGDPTSTITLTSSFSIAGATLPGIEANLTIDTGSYVLNATGNTDWNVASGVTLTLSGSSMATNGALINSGAGTLVLDDLSGDQSRTLAVDGGVVRIEGGSQVSSGLGGSWVGLRLAGGSLIVSGAGTKLTGNAGAASSTVANGTLSILDGAIFDTAAGLLMGGATSAINVRGTDSLYDGTSVAIRSGIGSINITDGGEMSTSLFGLGGLGSNSLALGGTGTVTISGDGSSWSNSSIYRNFNGTVNVLDGGLLETGSLHIAVSSNTSTVNAKVLVSGEGTRLTTSGTGANAFQIGGGVASTSNSGALTIAEGGEVSAAEGSGTINVANTATSTGIINIGGGSGEAATASGTLNAGSIVFGAGTSILNFNHTDAAYGFDVAITSGAGTGTINQIGSGKTVLTANQAAFTGKSNVLAGILEVNGTLGGTVDVFGGRLQGTGTVGATRNVTGGTVAPGNSIGTLTVNGNYTSDGGALEIEAILGADNSSTDLLRITGDSLLGTGATQVRVLNVGGAGAQTTADGIKIVQVDGDVSAADAFVLSGPAIGGAYRYNLFQNGLSDVTSSDGDWYLRSDGLAPTLPTYESYPAVMLGLISLPTLQQRVGDRRPGLDDKAGGNGLWTRIEGSTSRVKADSSTTSASYDSDLFQLQVGVDGQLVENASGALIAGLTAQYSRASADVSSELGNGSNTTEGYGIGANLTWYGANGVYVDSQAQFAWFNTDLSADGVGKLADGNNGTGYALSVELGKELAVAKGWTVTPQAQLAYASVDFDDMTDPFGAEISLRKGESLKGRVGAALGRDAAWQDAEGRKARAHVYGITSLTYEFLDGATVAVSGIDLVAEPQKFGAEFGLGGTYNWADERFALHGEAVASTSFDGSYGYKGTVGLTVGF